MEYTQIRNLRLFNGDCMEFMKDVPDKYYELAVVDPPYGINASEMTMGSGKNKKYKKGKEWDSSIPSNKYFKELSRISKNQIIWGGNYFTKYLDPTKSWIFWDKGIYGDISFADGELAWTSFDKVLRIAQIRYKGFLGADIQRIHPTQKTIKLYEWIYINYAKDGDKILDTHLGSGSSAIAAYNVNMNLTFDGIELDKEYFDSAVNRVREQTRQLSLF